MAGLTLRKGIHAWLWPRGNSFAGFDAPRVAADMRALGIVGVMPHGTEAMAAWCDGGATRAFRDAGLAVLPSLSWVDARRIRLALDVKEGDGAMLDWEGWWDGKRALAAQVVADVLTTHPAAPQRVTDCPWWAPLSYADASGRLHPTHPSAPTVEFGRLATGQRFVQAYGAHRGAHDGESTTMLANARRPDQYAFLAQHAGLAPWDIRPAHQMYCRSLNDHIRTLLAEDTVALWNWPEMDAACRAALAVVNALRTFPRPGGVAGFQGPGAVVEFQRFAGLATDGVVGAATAGALGVALPPGVQLVNAP